MRFCIYGIYVLIVIEIYLKKFIFFEEEFIIFICDYFLICPSPCTYLQRISLKNYMLEDRSNTNICIATYMKLKCNSNTIAYQFHINNIILILF